ncbi:hypothetical protein FBALC1_01187 [Flavobacteriales bacterium ALC-1]|nr:hypothetical protein FBALC1_01187 [Flavobacteriales bacterium ALC-1]
MNRIIPFLIFAFTLSSCTSEFKSVVFEINSIDTEFEADITVTYDKAIENNQLSKTINFNVEKAIIATLSDAAKKTNLEAVLQDFNSEYLNFKNDIPEAKEPIWELHIETEKTYQSEAIITIAISTYEFKGGAHGNDKIQFLNLDAKTGNILNQNDIIDNLAEFKKLAQTHFIKSLETEEDNLKMEDLFFGKPFQLPENIGFSEEGLVMLYNVYEIASFDQGYTEFAIPFDELEPYLKVN